MQAQAVSVLCGPENPAQCFQGDGFLFCSGLSGLGFFYGLH